MINVLISYDQDVAPESLFWLGRYFNIIPDRTSPKEMLDTVKTINPEVVAIDVSTSKALEIIRLLSQTFTQLKILATNASARSMMIKALEAGADGSTLKGMSSEEMKLALGAVEREYVLVNANKEKRCLILPTLRKSQSLEKWSYLVGIEIIKCWRYEPSPIAFKGCLRELENNTLFAALEQGSLGVSITKELERVIESLQQQNQGNWTVSKIKQVEAFLETWYLNPTSTDDDRMPNCCLAKIRANTRFHRTALIAKLRQLLGDWKSAGSCTLLKGIESVASTWRKIRQTIEKTQQEATQRAIAAKKAYQHQMKQLRLEKSRDFKTALQALLIRYQSDILAEVARAASQIIGELLEILQAEQETVAATETWLRELQASMNEDLASLVPSEMTWSPIPREALAANSVRDELEEHLGGSLIEWRNLLTAIKREVIKEKILTKARHIAIELIIEQY